MPSANTLFKGAKHSDSNTIIQDLRMLGIPEAHYKKVRLILDTNTLKTSIKSAAKYGISEIIFGPSGFGKTEIVRQVARELGMNIKELSLAKLVPEDLGAFPATDKQQMNTDEFRAIVKNNLYNEKMEEALAQEYANAQRRHQDVSNYGQFKKFAQRQIAKAGTIQVTDAEIDAAIAAGRFSEYQTVYRQVVAPPDWVVKILSDYRLHGTRTLLFLDELNQARKDTLNAAFGLILDRKFADRPEYDMKDAISIIAAGNFMKENDSLSDLSWPVLNRFTRIIYFDPDWNDSVEYLVKSYSNSETPYLTEFLHSDLIDPTDYALWAKSPRDLEDKFRFMQSIELECQDDPEAVKYWAGGADARNGEALSRLEMDEDNTPIGIREAARRFLAALGHLEVSKANTNSRMGEVQRGIRDLNSVFYKLARLGKVDFQGTEYTSPVDLAYAFAAANPQVPADKYADLTVQLMTTSSTGTKSGTPIKFTDWFTQNGGNWSDFEAKLVKA